MSAGPPVQVVLVPVPVAGQTWSKRTPQPSYPAQTRPERWRPAEAIPRPAHDDVLAMGKRWLAERREQRKAQQRSVSPWP
jgi:hypothetical protein